MEGALEVCSQKLSTSHTAWPGFLAELGLSSPRAPRSCPSTSVSFGEGGRWGVKIRKGTILDNKDFSLFCTDTKANS